MCITSLGSLGYFAIYGINVFLDKPQIVLDILYGVFIFDSIVNALCVYWSLWDKWICDVHIKCCGYCANKYINDFIKDGNNQPFIQSLNKN